MSMALGAKALFHIVRSRALGMFLVILLCCLSTDALRPALEVVAEEHKASPSSQALASSLTSDVSEPSQLQLRTVDSEAEASNASRLGSMGGTGWQVFYMVQASTKNSQVGVDDEIYAPRSLRTRGLDEIALKEVNALFKDTLGRGYIWLQLLNIEYVWVAPTKGAMGTAMAFYGNVLNNIVLNGGDVQEFAKLMAFRVLPELRPFQRWPNIWISKGGETKENGDYVGRVRKDGEYTLATDLKELSTYLSGLADRIMASFTAWGDDDDVYAVSSALASAAGQLYRSFEDLLRRPDHDTEDEFVDPLDPPRTTKEVFSRIHKIKAMMYKVQYRKSKDDVAGRILMVGDPIWATWMFPTVIANDAGATISPHSLTWGRLALPGPTFFIEARWNYVVDVVSDDEDDVAISHEKLRRLKMAESFYDVERGPGVPLSFAGRVPYFWSMTPYHALDISPVLTGTTSWTSICLDDDMYVLPEFAQIQQGILGAMPLREAYRSVLPSNSKFSSYMMTVKRDHGGTGFKNLFETEKTALVYIVAHDDLGTLDAPFSGTPKKEAYVSWVAPFKPSLPDTFVDLNTGTCTLMGRTSYHIVLTGGGATWKLTPLDQTEATSFMTDYRVAKAFAR
mmetsp:Transcript_42917/g.100766  ORF Transcript_42917/g.100766 Transcript_42917/m.100766 type:complete len:622 (-) Transcript_42917:163-2028(-)